jgi:serine phosphatase RsbU (regulator of sigma subunit)
VTNIDGDSLIVSGSGVGDPWKLPIEVNGRVAGWVIVTPGGPDASPNDMLRLAIDTFQSLAEIRNSMADLVRTTAHQWRELSLLYRFSDLVAGGQDPEALATLLVEQAQRALRSHCGAIAYRLRQDAGFTSVGDRATELRELAVWGSQLESGEILAAGEGPSAAEFPGDPPAEPVLVVPLRCRDQSYGSLVVASGTGDVFNAEDLKLASLLARQAGLAYANLELIDQVRENERIRRELEVAAEIQASILPPAYTETSFFEIAGTCLPAQWVGGDTFFVLPQEDGLLAGVADVSGHGISSALLMNTFASEIEALSRTLTGPAELLNITNPLVSARVGTMGLFVTVVLMRFRDDGTVSVANAGHPPPMIVSPDGRVDLVEASGLPLGVLDDEVYEEYRLETPQSGSVLVYSDGITEAVTPGGVMYGCERLRRSLAASTPSADNAKEIRRRILDDLLVFEEGGVRSDDLTVLVVRRKT